MELRVSRVPVENAHLCFCNCWACYRPRRIFGDDKVIPNICCALSRGSPFHPIGSMPLDLPLCQGGELEVTFQYDTAEGIYPHLDHDTGSRRPVSNYPLQSALCTGWIGIFAGSTE
jgi:hypothetical protein